VSPLLHLAPALQRRADTQSQGRIDAPIEARGRAAKRGFFGDVFNFQLRFPLAKSSQLLLAGFEGPQPCPLRREVYIR
jgi:hypothetical protein